MTQTHSRKITALLAGIFAMTSALAPAATAAAFFSVTSSSITDGARTSVSIVGGANAADGNGNVTFYFNYQHTDPVLREIGLDDAAIADLRAREIVGGG